MGTSVIGIEYKNEIEGYSSEVGWYDSLEELLLSALGIDGAHHKQFYLELLLRLIVGDERWERLHAQNLWEDGIAP